MALKHDAQGFLAGDPIDIGRALSVWDEISRDVKAIQATMGALSAPPSTPSNVSVRAANDAPMHREFPQRATGSDLAAVLPKEKKQPPQVASVLVSLNQAGGKTTATPRARDSVGRFVKVGKPKDQSTSAFPTEPKAQTPSSTLKTIRNKATKTKVSPAIPAGRGKNGRFEKVSQPKSPGSHDGGQPGSRTSDDSLSAESRTLLDRLTSTLTNTATGAGNSLEDADPAVKAVQEIAQPLSRGYKMLMGDGAEKKKEGWYRRIYASLTGLRKEEEKANKATLKSLKVLEEKPVGDQNQTGFWGGILKGLLGIGPAIVTALMAFLSKIPVIGKLFGGGEKAPAGGVRGGFPKGAMAKGFLRKLPLIGALFGAVGAASDIYGSETDDKLTRKEKDQNAGKATGGLAGTLAGGWAGASAGAAIGLLGGPIGAAIGGVVGGAVGMFFGDQAGQIMGETIGGWVGELRQVDIAGRIAMAWESVTGAISGYWTTAMGAWDATAQSVSGAWDGVVASFAKVSEGIGKAWGDFVALAKSGWDSFSGLFKSAYEGLKSLPVVGAAIQAAEDAAKATAAAASKVAAKAVEAAKEAAAKAATAAKEKAQAVKEKAVEVVDKTTTTAKEAATVVKEKGAAVANKAVDAVETGAKAATKAAGDGSAWVGKNTTVGKGVVAAYEGVKSAGNWALGKTSQMFESGKGGAGTVSTGKGDFGGASYGTYQLSSKQGKVQDFLKSGKYGNQFAGLQPGTPEFNAKWKDVSKADPEFGNAQHEYIKKTNFDPAAQGLKAAGMDLSGRGAAVQDALWSTSVQFGAGSQKKGSGAIGMFQKALAGKDVAKMSDADLVTAVQDYKINNNDKLFASSSDAVKQGTAGRAVEEKKRLVALAGQGSTSDAPVLQKPDAIATKAAVPISPSSAATVTATSPAPVLPVTVATAQVQTAYAPAPQVPKFSPPPVIAEAPAVVSPMGTGADSRKQVAAATASQDVGQDLKDRRIAHIVTGGFSA